MIKQQKKSGKRTEHLKVKYYLFLLFLFFLSSTIPFESEFVETFWCIVGHVVDIFEHNRIQDVQWLFHFFDSFRGRFTACSFFARFFAAASALACACTFASLAFFRLSNQFCVKKFNFKIKII